MAAYGTLVLKASEGASVDAAPIIGITGIALTVLAMGLGYSKLELSHPWLVTMTLLELGVLVASVVLMGPLIGSLIAFSVVSGLILITSIRLAVQYDEVATDAAIHWRMDRDKSKNFMRSLVRSEGKHFQVLGLLGSARLAAALAKCARSPEEITLMAKPIAMLGAVFHENPVALAPRFDRLMRRFGEPPERAMHMADVLTRASQLTPGSFEEVMKGLEAFVGTSDEPTE